MSSETAPTEKARRYAAVPILAEPLEQPALDRGENLQLDGYC